MPGGTPIIEKISRATAPTSLTRNVAVIPTGALGDGRVSRPAAATAAGTAGTSSGGATGAGAGAPQALEMTSVATARPLTSTRTSRG